MADRNRQMAQKIAQAAADAGGRAYYVGGMVRDSLLGRENKDVDIEVHGLPPQLLEDLLDSLGERTVMGASFGIYGLKHYDLDIAMPRREAATGRGHRDFAVFTDPFLGPEKACLRRDFTINAMMEDILTGEIIDCAGGKEDLAQGRIRHVSDASFPEDPLRVLRGAQFAARFGFTVAPATIALCASMDLSPLPGERVMEELKKALLKAPRPSVFFRVLREMDQLKTWFPELEALAGIPQDSRFHPEGDAWEHTLLAVDQAAELRQQAREPLAFMLSALCHDFGKQKAIQFEGERIRALGHEEAGLPLAEAFLSRLTSEKALHRYVRNMVELHMRPNILAAQNSRQKAFNRLFDRSCCPEDLLLLAKADALASGAGNGSTAYEPLLEQRLAAFRELMARPFVKGADLAAAGFPPAGDYGEALAFAHTLRLSGVSREAALPQTAAFLRKLREESGRQNAAAPAQPAGEPE